MPFTSIIDHAPVDTPMYEGSELPMNAVWAQWFEVRRSQIQTGEIILSDPYPNLLHIVGGEGIGILVEQKIGTPGVNKGYFGISSTVTVQQPFPNTTSGSVALAGVVQHVGGGGLAFGLTTEVYAGNATSAPLINTAMSGAEFKIIQQFNANTAFETGVSIVFANRTGATPLQGVGANQYSNNSAGLFLTSQSRSGLGESCGWSVGILYDVNSVDIPVAGGVGIGIDMHQVPVARLGIAMWLNNSARIEWSSSIGTCESHYDNSLGVWGLVHSGSNKWAVDVSAGGNAGKMFLVGPTSSSVGAAGAASALPANPLGYIVVNQDGSDVKIPYYNT